MVLVDREGATRELQGEGKLLFVLSDIGGQGEGVDVLRIFVKQWFLGFGLQKDAPFGTPC